MTSNSRVKQSLFQLVVVLTVASTATGCSVAKEYHELVHGFWVKVDHLARADQINEQLNARIVVLEKENLQFRQSLAQNLESQRAQHLKSEALHEGGFEGARTEKSLVPEIYGKTKSHGVANRHAVAALEASKGHRSPASHGGVTEHHAPAGHGEKTETHKKTAHGESTAHHAAAPHGESTAHSGTDAHAKTPAHAVAPEEVAETEEDESATDLSIMSVPPKKIFAESMKAFERHEFDRAARGFVALANHKENRIYATAQVNYMAGVSLFELHNYAKSLQYFQKSYDLAGGNRQPASGGNEISNNIVFAPRSLGWMALAHRKLGRKAEAQEKIHELINRFPHSAEAKRFR